MKPKKEQMLFIISDELRNNTDETLNKVLTFLNVDTNFNFKKIKTKQGKIPNSVILARLSKTRFCRKVKPIKYLIKKINIRKKYPPMSKKTRKKLEKYYEKPNKKLEELIDIKVRKIWY